MWPFTRRRAHVARRPTPPAEPQNLLVRVHVIGMLTRGSFRVAIAGTGLVEGIEADWPVDWVPESERRPNGEFVVSGFRDGVPQAATAS